MFLADSDGGSSGSVLETVLYVGGSLLASLGGWKGVVALFSRVKQTYQQNGMLAAGNQFAQVLAANREFVETLYTQFKAVVKAADTKDKAVAALLQQLPPEVIAKLRTDKTTLGASFTLDTLPAIDLAAIPFKDIVNEKLVAAVGTNDELLKSLVKSARDDEAASKAVDRVAGILGAVAGEGLNIGSKILTGGTISAKDVVGFVSGVGSTALGARSSKD